MGAEHSSTNANAASNKLTSVQKQVGKSSTELSVYQKSLLCRAWQHITKSGSGTIGNMVFRKMLNKSPDMKKLFQHVTVIEGVFGFGLTPIQAYHQHGVLFTTLLNDVMSDLDDFSHIAERCRDFGAQHAPYQAYGFREDYWDTFGASLMESAREWEGWKKHRETLKAWAILVSFIVDRLRHGYEDAVKKQCQQTETGNTLPQPNVQIRSASTSLLPKPEESSEKSHTPPPSHSSMQEPLQRASSN